MPIKQKIFPLFLFLALPLVLQSSPTTADSALTMGSPTYEWWEPFFGVPSPTDDDIELSNSEPITALLFDPTNATAINPEPIRKRPWPYSATGGAYMYNNIIYVDNFFNLPGKTPVMKIDGGLIVDID